MTLAPGGATGLRALRPELCRWQRRRGNSRPCRRQVRASPISLALGIDGHSGSPRGTVSPLADGGYDIADYRVTSTRPSAALRGSGATHRRGARPSAPGSIVERPELRSDSTPFFPGRARISSRLCRAGAVLVPRGPQALNGDEMPTAWPSNFSAGTGTRTVERRRLTRLLEPPSLLVRPTRSQLGPSACPSRHEEVIRFWLDLLARRELESTRRPCGSRILTLPQVPG